MGVKVGSTKSWDGLLRCAGPKDRRKSRVEEIGARLSWRSSHSANGQYNAYRALVAEGAEMSRHSLGGGSHRVGGVAAVMIEGSIRGLLERSEGCPGTLQAPAGTGTEDAAIADLAETSRKNMLEKATDEVDCGQGDLAEHPGFVVPVAEADPALVDGLDPRVADGNTKEVAAQVVEDFLSGSSWSAVKNPLLLPDLRRRELEEPLVAQGLAELGAEDEGKGRERDEESGVCRIRPCAVRRDSAGGDEEVDVWMIEQGAGPGMKDAEDPGHGTEVARIARELEDGGGGGLHEDGVKLLLMGPGQRAEIGGQSGGEQVGGARQEPFPLPVEPPLGLLSLAFGTMAILAGVIAVVCFPTAITAQEVTSEVRGTAVLEVAQDLLVAGQDAGAEALPVLPCMEAEDLRQLWHGTSVRRIRVAA